MDEGSEKIVKKLNKVLEQNKNILEDLQEMEKKKTINKQLSK